MSKKGKAWQNRDKEYNITPLELLDIYHRLEKLFDDVAILGGRAVNIYIFGDKRFTKDIDVAVKLPDVPLKMLKDAILENGFIYETYDDGKLKKLINRETNTSIDLYYSADLGGIHIEDLLSLAKTRTLGHDSETVKVVNPALLILMKLKSNRPKDIEDVGKLIQNLYGTPEKFIEKENAVLSRYLDLSDFGFLRSRLETARYEQLLRS
ncbi:MAG: nucleotidyltransferase [Candidatus Marsarchaeota archaeon]|nr:nucleotidyltransferase [Candidatus Marsarchaeota archaeon]